MVASSRSSRGRISLRSDQGADQHRAAGEEENTHSLRRDHGRQHAELGHESQPSSPRFQSQNPRNSSDATTPGHLVSPSQTQSSSTRSKRSRIASVSDRESLQKRRRTTKDTEQLPALAIPLRGRAGTLPGKQGLPAWTPPNATGTSANPRPQLSTHDSQASFSSAQSPLQSPYQRPQYDQFRRIEEKAQKTAQKRINSGTVQDDKRKLRSEHGSTRSKTELAQYFPNFDDMMSLQKIDPGTLTHKTPVLLIDDTPSFTPNPPRNDYFKSTQAPYGSVVVDLSQYKIFAQSREDPLADHVYLKSHQKAERHEKQIKNGDKERAQHEKYQLERLLDELRGPDWLKTLGVSGITDTEKKRYESKRILFIRETRALIDKFKRWKEEEKRRKLERQQQLLEEAEADAEADADADTDARSSKAGTPALRRKKGVTGKPSQRSLLAVKSQSRTSSRAASLRREILNSSTDPTHDSNDIDALASQQLLKEAKMANVHRKRLSTSSLVAAVPPPEDAIRRPFVSFFDKRHIRDAAVENRLRGRKSYAFGQEILDLTEQDYELPEDLLTDDLIRSSQRNRRRRMRGTDE